MTLKQHHQAARFRKEPRPATIEDLRQQEIIDYVGKGVVAALRPILEANPHKLLGNLQRHELDVMVVGAISAYIEKRQELEAAAKALNDPVDDIPLVG